MDLCRGALPRVARAGLSFHRNVQLQATAALQRVGACSGPPRRWMLLLYLGSDIWRAFASSVCLVSAFHSRVLSLGSSVCCLLFSFSVLGGAGVACEKPQLRHIPITSLLDSSAHCQGYSCICICGPSGWASVMVLGGRLVFRHI